MNPTHLNPSHWPWPVRGNILQTLLLYFPNNLVLLSYTLQVYLLKIKLLFPKHKCWERHILCATSFTSNTKIFKVIFPFILALKQFICFLYQKPQNLCSWYKIIFLQNTILVNYMLETYVMWALILLQNKYFEPYK